MSRRKLALPDLSVLAFWLLLIYLVYRADPTGGRTFWAVLEGLGHFLSSQLAWVI